MLYVYTLVLIFIAALYLEISVTAAEEKHFTYSSVSDSSDSLEYFPMLPCPPLISPRLASNPAALPYPVYFTSLITTEAIRQNHRSIIFTHQRLSPFSTFTEMFYCGEWNKCNRK